MGGRKFKSQFSSKHLYLLAFFELQLCLTLSLGIPSTHRNGTWVARHLGSWKFWLLMDICFCLSFTAFLRHWCRGKRAREQLSLVVVHSSQNRIDEQLSCGFDPLLSQFFFSVSRPFWSRFFVQWWYMFWAFALTLLCMLVIKLEEARVFMMASFISIQMNSHVAG